MVFNACVLLYILMKNRLPTKRVENKMASFLIGAALGCVSAFLGIGGGTSNVAVLFFSYSMDARQAAKNSLFIILFSQMTSLLLSIATGTVPAFAWPDLLVMAAGGVAGAMVGTKVSTAMKTSRIETLMKGFLSVIILINLYTFLKFAI